MEIGGRHTPTLFVSSQKLAHIPNDSNCRLPFSLSKKLYFRRRVALLKKAAALNFFHKFFFSSALSLSFIPQMLLQSLKILRQDKIALAPDFNGSNVFWLLRNDEVAKVKKKNNSSLVKLCLCVWNEFSLGIMGVIEESYFSFSLVRLNICLIFVWQCFIYRFYRC